MTVLNWYSNNRISVCKWHSRHNHDGMIFKNQCAKIEKKNKTIIQNTDNTIWMVQHTWTVCQCNQMDIELVFVN